MGNHRKDRIEKNEWEESRIEEGGIAKLPGKERF